MGQCNNHRNYLQELAALLQQIKSTEMEPEVCNVTCPPLGCPKGTCPGLGRDKHGLLDPCCLTAVPSERRHMPHPPIRPQIVPPRSCCRHGH